MSPWLLLLPCRKSSASAGSTSLRITLRSSRAPNWVEMTSNAGAEDIRSASSTVGFHRTSSIGDGALSNITERALERIFSPEFLGRLDETLLFTELDIAAARLIAQDQLTDLAVRARRTGRRVCFTAAVSRWVAERGFSTQFGARELRNVIRREVEPALAELFLQGSRSSQGLIRTRVQNGALRSSPWERVSWTPSS